MNNWHEAEMSLRLADSRIAGIIERAGPCELIPHEGGFAGLASAIIGQQLSNQVANIIRTRFRKLFENELPDHVYLLKLEDSFFKKDRTVLPENQIPAWLGAMGEKW
jgi:3-methyladenine DNA glycosylase/8-oxoguanine DNA glycosylase